MYNQNDTLVISKGKTLDSQKQSFPTYENG